MPVPGFECKDQYEAATQNEVDWVQQNQSSLLPAPVEETAGDAVVYGLNTDLICDPGPEPTTATAEPTPCTGTGCPCNGSVENACNTVSFAARAKWMAAHVPAVRVCARPPTPVVTPRRR